MSSAKTAFFIDSGGFYALLDKSSGQHGAAAKWMSEARAKRWSAATSDYILDETATLLRARGLFHLAPDLFALAEHSRALSVIRIDSDYFEEAKSWFLKYKEHDFSFTDCSSFAVMKRLGLRNALATDAHFRHAGFHPVLAKA